MNTRKTILGRGSLVVLLTIILLLTAYAARPENKLIPDRRKGQSFSGSTMFQGHFYAFTGNESWISAEQEAQDRGGHLVSVNSQEEEDFLNQNVIGQNPFSFFWIGLSDQEDEGAFVWTNGDPLTYTNWWPGQPDDNGGEDFVGMNFDIDPETGTGFWNDFPEPFRLRGIIEFEFVQIVASHSNKCMEVQESSIEDGANVRQFSCAGLEQTNQLWGLEPVELDGETFYQVRPQSSDKCLAVEGASLDAAANVIQSTCTLEDHQLWNLEPRIVADRNLNLITARHSGQCLDVEAIGLDDGANILQFPCHGGDNQLWGFQESIAPLPPLNLSFARPIPWDFNGIVIQNSPGPDISPDLPNFTSRDLSPNEPLFLDFIVQNQGTRETDFVVRLTVGGQTVADLDFMLPGGGQRLFADFELLPLPPGRHRFELEIDPDNLVEESNEFDNSLGVSLSIGGPEFLYLPQFGAGSGLTSEIVVSNRSTTRSATGSVSFFDPDGQLIDAESLIPGGTGFDLAPHGSTVLRMTQAPAGEIVTGSALVSSDSPVSVVIRF